MLLLTMLMGTSRQLIALGFLPVSTAYSLARCSQCMTCHRAPCVPCFYYSQALVHHVGKQDFRCASAPLRLCRRCAAVYHASQHITSAAPRASGFFHRSHASFRHTGKAHLSSQHFVPALTALNLSFTTSATCASVPAHHFHPLYRSRAAVHHALRAYHCHVASLRLH
jgi:hypothetical protein